VQKFSAFFSENEYFRTQLTLAMMLSHMGFHGLQPKEAAMAGRAPHLTILVKLVQAVATSGATLGSRHHRYRASGCK